MCSKRWTGGGYKSDCREGITVTGQRVYGGVSKIPNRPVRLAGWACLRHGVGRLGREWSGPGKRWVGEKCHTRENTELSLSLLPSLLLAPRSSLTGRRCVLITTGHSHKPQHTYFATSCTPPLSDAPSRVSSPLKSRPLRPSYVTFVSIPTRHPDSSLRHAKPALNETS